MKVSIIISSLILQSNAHVLGPRTETLSRPHKWQPAGKGDFRGPCPMMNTLANHGFLPFNGKSLTREIVVSGLGEGLNFNSDLANIMFDQALPANPEPNATSFDLHQLNRHNVLEHDASLSRSDAYFGNNHVFNSTIFEQTKLYWTDEILTSDMLGNSKIARQLQSKATNPTYTFTNSTENFSIGEILAPVVAFGDVQSATVNRTLVEYFFEHERLPHALGWTKKTKETTLSQILELSKKFQEASSLITGSTATGLMSRANLHIPLAMQ